MKHKQKLNESVVAHYRDGTSKHFKTLKEASANTGLADSLIRSRCNSKTGAKSKDGITFEWADEHTKKAKQAKRNKAKGNALELEIVNKLKSIGYKGVVSSRAINKQADANKIDIVDTKNELQCNIQCKYTQNMPNYFDIRDACTDKDKPFCVVWKKASNDGSQSRGTVVVIPVNYFYDLIKK